MWGRRYKRFRRRPGPREAARRSPTRRWQYVLGAAGVSGWPGRTSTRGPTSIFLRPQRLINAIGQLSEAEAPRVIKFRRPTAITRNQSGAINRRSGASLDLGAALGARHAPAPGSREANAKGFRRQPAPRGARGPTDRGDGHRAEDLVESSSTSCCRSPTRTGAAARRAVERCAGTRGGDGVYCATRSHEPRTRPIRRRS